MGVRDGVALVVLVVGVSTAGAQVVGPGVRRSSVRPVRAGLTQPAKVTLPTRLDWVFAAPPGTPAAALAMPDYGPARQLYRLLIPSLADARPPFPLILYVSPLDEPKELAAWDAVCSQEGVVLAVPYWTGDTTPPARRVRVALDVLDDVRRRLPIDTDRIYLAGAGGGAATACHVAYAFPEVCGGVLAVGGAGPLRPEPWLRQRAKDRLSVALVAGEGQPGRAELERGRAVQLHNAGVRSRLWVQGGPDALPPLAPLYEWLEGGLAGRRTTAAKYTASRLANGDVAAPEAWAAALLREARARITTDEEREAGLMQLEGITSRWPASAAAREAERILKDYNARSREGWQAIYRREQIRHAYSEAKVAGVALVNVPEREAMRRAAAAATALAAWSEVVRLGPDTKEGRRRGARWSACAGGRRTAAVSGSDVLAGGALGSDNAGIASEGLLMSAALFPWAGMPSPPELTEVARLRLESLSFFGFVFLASAGLVALVWRGFRHDFPWLPALGFPRALGLTFLWGLVFVLVLTMISGARELLTPGAWKRQGWTYALEEGTPAPTVAADTSELARRQKMEELRFALWDHARKGGGRFPSSAEEASFPAERWQVPGPSGLRYLYSGKNPPTGEAVPLAWEPEAFGPQRLVLFSDGAVGSMDTSALERVLKGGGR